MLLTALLLATQAVEPAPLGPLPSPRQLARHELGYYAFVHFNMNKLTDLEARLFEEASDIYAFHLASDDGSRLWIGGEPLIDNDGLHGRRERIGRVGLREGYHPLRVEYFNGTGAAALALTWSRGGAAPTPIPPSLLVHR